MEKMGGFFLKFLWYLTFKMTAYGFDYCLFFFYCAFPTVHKAMICGPIFRESAVKSTFSIIMILQERQRILLCAADLLEKHNDELAALENWDNGKSYEHCSD